MVERKDRMNPGKTGYTRIPEPGGGGASVTRLGMTPNVKAKVARGVYKEARKTVKAINRSTEVKRKTARTEARDKSNSDYWNQGPARGVDSPTAKARRAANAPKGKDRKAYVYQDGEPLQVRKNPFKSEFKMKMDAASKGKTERGKFKGDNDNRYKTGGKF